jgi:hypothetical protein
MAYELLELRCELRDLTLQCFYPFLTALGIYCHPLALHVHEVNDQGMHMAEVERFCASVLEILPYAHGTLEGTSNVEGIVLPAVSVDLVLVVWLASIDRCQEVQALGKLTIAGTMECTHSIHPVVRYVEPLVQEILHIVLAILPDLLGPWATQESSDLTPYLSLVT